MTQPFTNSLAGMTALITGATSGIGRAIAEHFADLGARLMLTGRNEAAGNELASRLGAGFLDGDITDPGFPDRLVAHTLSAFGRLDILVNAVGGYAGGKNVWEADVHDYDQMMALNLKAGFALAHAVVPVMIRQNRGWIVNVASKAGYGASPGAALYAASKAAALTLIESLAAEVKPYNINVNLIVPSIFDTAANRQAMPKADFSKWPKPEQIASVILFLCSEEGQLIHGAAIPVYGHT